MFVKDWMTAPAVFIDPSSTIAEAEIRMDLHKVRRLAVVERGQLVGMLTRSDCAAAHNRTRAVGMLMAKSPYRVSPDETLEGATRMMFQNKISGLPVVDNGVLVGMITESDVFRAMASMMGFGEPGARLELTVPDEQDVVDAIQRKVAGRHLRSLVTWHDAAKGRWEVTMRLSGADPSDRRAAESQRRPSPV